MRQWWAGALVLSALLSGCVSSPAGNAPDDLFTPRADASRPEPAPSTSARTNGCGLPERPPGTPRDHQAGESVVPITVRVVRSHPDSPMPDKEVAAVAVSQEVRSSRDTAVESNDCAFASAKTGEDGKASLWLADGQIFHVALQAPFAQERSTKGPFVAQAGLVIPLAWLDPAGAPLGDCDVPTAPYDLPRTEAYAVDLVPVDVTVRWETSAGEPVEGTDVALLHSSVEPPFDGTFGMDRFFTECVLANGETGPDGTLRLWAPRNATVHIAVPPATFGSHGGEALAEVQVGSGGSWVVPVLFTELHPTAAGQIMLPDEMASVPVQFHPDAAVSDRYQARIERLSFAYLSWNNTPVAWGDLFGGFRIGEGPLKSDEFSDEPQGPLDGAVEETLFPPWSPFDETMCEIREEGIQAVAYSVPQRIVAPLKLDFQFRLDVHFADNPLFLDRFAWVDCPDP